jgi:hypothetical protein
MNPIEETPSAGLLCWRHWSVLIGGFLAGLVAANIVAAIPFDFSGKLAEARRLGIVSLTILNGYPKSRDVLWYAALILFPVTCSLGAWLVWSRGRRNELAALFRNGPAAAPISFPHRRIVALAVFLFFLLATFNVNNFYEPIGGWAFLGEEGEFLAWTQILLTGGDYARDFFCLYGPLVLYPLAWVMKLFGASVVVGRFYTYGLTLISGVILMAFLYRTIRSRGIFFLSALLMLVIFMGGVRTSATMLRVSLGFVPLLILYRYLGSNRKLPMVATGVVLGLSLLFSQEVGICALIATGAFLCLEARTVGEYRRLARQGGLVAAGCCMMLAPMLGYFYRVNAFDRFFESMYGFPKLNMLGYCSIPFPSFTSFLAAPLTSGAFFPYWIIGIYLFSAIYLLVLLFLHLDNRDINIRAALLVFGLLLFRSALGRSDESHFYFSAPPAFLLAFLMLDDALRGLAKRHLKVVRTGQRVLVSALLLSLVLLIWSSRVLRENVTYPFMELGHVTSKFRVQETGVALPQLHRGGVFFDPPIAENLVKIGRALDRYTQERDHVLFFPNEAAYYFLLNRRVPTRYVHAYFAITTDQRREMVAELEERRPAYVVYSLDDPRIDGIPENIQVPEVLSYLRENYILAEDLGGILLLRRKDL